MGNGSVGESEWMFGTEKHNIVMCALNRNRGKMAQLHV